MLKLWGGHGPWLRPCDIHVAHKLLTFFDTLNPTSFIRAFTEPFVIKRIKDYFDIGAHFLMRKMNHALDGIYAVHLKLTEPG